MSVTLAPPQTVETIADLLQRLGDIGPERICLRAPPGTASETDVLAALEAPRKRICELIDGVLVEKAMGYEESFLATYLIILIDAFVRPRNLGLVAGADSMIRLWAGRVRIPDVAFFSWDRFPDRRRIKQLISSAEQPVSVFTETDVLDGAPVLPEFTLPLQELFAELDRHG